MSDVLTGLDGVVCMMDDVLVHGESAEEHNDRLEKVLKKAGLTLNNKKCRFSQTQVKFLGQVVDRDGIRPDPDKVRAQNVAPPNNVSEIL